MSLIPANTSTHTLGRKTVKLDQISLRLAQTQPVGRYFQIVFGAPRSLLQRSKTLSFRINQLAAVPLVGLFESYIRRSLPKNQTKWTTKHLLLAPVAVAATTAETHLTALPSAPPRVPQPATTAARRATLAVNAPLPRLRRPATAAVVPATSPASAPRTVAPPWAAVAAAARSATSAARSVTLPATAPREADTVVLPVDTEEAAVATAAVPVATAVLARPPATRAVVSAT